MKDSFRKLIKFFDKKEKKRLLLLFIMMIVAAIFETLGIGLIVPFVGIVTKPEIIQENSILRNIYNLLNFQSANSFIVFAVIFFLLLFIIKNIYLILFNHIQNKIILNQQVKLSRELFQEYLTKPYTFHLQRNTAILLRNVNGEVGKVFQGIILSAFQLITEVFIILCILALLLVKSPIATLTASILICGSVGLFFKFFRGKISNLGKEQQIANGEMIKWVNQGLGANKEVKVAGKESFFINAYTNQSQISINNSIYLRMLEIVPRYFIETLLIFTVLITMLIVVLQGKNESQLVSTMALFAMAAFRLLPSINRVVGLITNIRYNHPALNVVYEDLYNNTVNQLSMNNISDNNIEFENKKRVFNNSIILDRVSYRYPNQMEYSIMDVSLTIPIGHSVAFIGESGAGKTTLVDIVLGLLKPEQGKVIIDGNDLKDSIALWQKKIGYIPQSIYLSDDTIRGNIAFGIESNQIDDSKVWRALEQAHLKEFVEALPDKLNTAVGERGVRLSGGQRQRIGIARALYHNPEILFMDEATSALDNETEREIMKAIDRLRGEKTLIIIAHRLSTIKNCDTIFKINSGKLVEIKNQKQTKNVELNYVNGIG